MCLYPKLVQNPKYKPNKKNGGNVPHMQDKRVGLVPIKCGLCMECAKARAGEWKGRLLEEVKYNKMKGNFVTLTFSNEAYTELVGTVLKDNKELKGYDLDNAVATKSIERWRGRWRKHNKKSPKHWFITELGHGETEHLHMHGIVWTDMPADEINKRWGYGWVTIGDGKKRNYVNEETIGYITKYITKLDPEHKYYKPKILCSPGIGKDFVSGFNAGKCAYKGAETKTSYTTPGGFEMNMNVYWRNKIYTEEEREALWLHKLDKGEMWVGGEKIKSDDMENRAKLLKYYQKVSNRLGYGSPGNWEAKRYEEERRALYQQKRIVENSDIRIIRIESFQEPGLDDW